MKIKSIFAVAILLSCFTGLAQADSKDTGNYVASKIDTLDGSSAKVDVAYLVKINLEVPNHDVALFKVFTVDREHGTFGGNILLIADPKDADSLIKKYGTSAVAFGSNVRYKSLKGTAGRIQHAGKEDLVFINTSSDTDAEHLPIEQTVANTVVNHGDAQK
jgi:hypothetical protein